jgi:PAS domain S-box-containing protein
MRNQTTEVSSGAVQTSALNSFISIAGPMFEALERSRLPILITDPTLPDNPAIFANEAFSRLTGYASEDILGRNCRILQGRDTDPKVVAEISAALKDPRPIEV